MVNLTSLVLLSWALLAPGEDGAAVSGFIVRQSTGQALKRVPLELRANRGENSYRAVSGADGRFAFSGVSPGEYRLESSGMWTVKRLSGPDGPLDRRRFTISARAELAGLKAQVSTLGVVRGTVRYEDGEPAWLPVALLAVDGGVGRNGTCESATNSRGDYEIVASPPGAYYVVAIPHDNSRFVSLPTEPGQDSTQAPTGYAHSFYPGVSSMRSASAITIADDSEIEGVDITLRPVPLVNLHGRIVNSATGQPLPGKLSISAAGAVGFIEDPAELRASPGADGAFIFHNVPAGSYFLRGKGMEWWVTEEIELGTAPEQQVTFYYHPPRPIEGRLVMEAAEAKPAPWSFQFEYADRVATSIEIGKDGTFRAEIEPGLRFSLRLHVSSDPGLYIRSARLDGHAVAPGELAVPAGADAARLELVVADGAGRLTVEVPEAAEQTKVAVVSTEGDHPGGRLGIEEGADGRYVAARVPPGEVTVLTWTGAEPCDFAAPASCRGKGVSVAVQPGAVQNVRVPAAK